jgi:hypothetical protein
MCACLPIDAFLVYLLYLNYAHINNFIIVYKRERNMRAKDRSEFPFNLDSNNGKEPEEEI